MTTLEHLTADIIYNIKTHETVYVILLAELAANIFDVSFFLMGDKQISDLLLLAFLGHLWIYGSIGLAIGLCSKTGFKVVFKVISSILKFVKSILNFPKNVREILKQKEAND